MVQYHESGAGTISAGLHVEATSSRLLVNFIFYWSWLNRCGPGRRHLGPAGAGKGIMPGRKLGQFPGLWLERVRRAAMFFVFRPVCRFLRGLIAGVQGFGKNMSRGATMPTSIHKI